MTGKLHVIGTGPGNPDQMTPEARRAVEASTEFFGYFPYIDRLDLRPDQIKVASDNREELNRAEAALARAAVGVNVCVVSGGDREVNTDLNTDRAGAHISPAVSGARRPK